MREGVGGGKELQHIDPHSIGHGSVSFSFSSAAQLAFSTSSCLTLVWSPTDWTSCAPRHIIFQRSPSSCGRHKSHSFSPSTVKIIFWYSSTGCTCYLQRCISYSDSPAGSEINIQHLSEPHRFKWSTGKINQRWNRKRKRKLHERSSVSYNSSSE